MKSLKVVFIIGFIIGFNVVVFPTEFIDIKVGARSNAMGRAFTAVSDDANLVQYNPAGLSFLLRKELMISYVRWFGDIDTQYLSYVHPKFYKGLNVGLGLQWFDDILERTDINGVKIGEVKITESLTLISLSTKLSDKLSIGTNIKYFTSTLGRYSSQSIILDVGAVLLSVVDIGVSINSYQLLPLKYRETEEMLPASLSFGIAKFFRKLCVAADVRMPLFGAAASPGIHLGVEYFLFRELALQAGYKIGYGENISGGIRFNLIRGEDIYILNLAYIPSVELGNAFSASFNIKFK
ncbi:MAG: PorV/PorQ family protein [Elusimicrobiota bacterium]|nr:PorV/PorQ family protein [Endomicrobiia bacterium]MDW8165671.1 PorV/PorQ family protein [Elusimicrobiota bacterium]